MRVELQSRRDRAQAVAQVLADNGGDLAGVAGVLYGLLDFKAAGSAAQKCRWDTCEWWAQFVGHVSKLRLALQAVARTLDEVRQWVVRQVGPSLAMLLQAAGGEVQQLLSVCASGRARWRPRHLALIASAAG